MDPDVALMRMRNAVVRVSLNIDGKISLTDEEKFILLHEMSANFDVLDEWITRGGALPQSWE